MAMLFGIVVSALLFGVLLRKFSEVHLIQVIQGAALTTLILNFVSLWQQESRDRTRAPRPADPPAFGDAWRTLAAGGQAMRRLIAIGLGTVAFSMQDILLEPYGGQVLGLSVGATTGLTALLGAGGMGGFLVSARALGRDTDPYRLAAFGALAGIVAFTALIFAAPLHSAALFATGVAAIGFGAGLFAAGTLTAVMALAAGQAGLALGAWGAVQATAAGMAVAAGGLLRDGFASLAADGRFGSAMTDAASSYGVVYQVEIILLFATLVALGPLVRSTGSANAQNGLGIAGTCN